MEAIGQLAAGVAHDFNNILTVIQGHVGLMQQELNGECPQTKSLEQVSKAASRAATLIRQLLMFSRKQVMQFRHLDLNDTLRNTVKMLERLVGEHVQIDFYPQESLPAIHADPSMLEQIAMNLAVNARDAMPNGGQVSISTSLETIHRPPTPMDPEQRDGDYLCLTFSDTGTGMDTQILSRIFEPFFTTKPVGKGTGFTNTPATNSLPDMNTNVPASTNQWSMVLANILPSKNNALKKQKTNYAPIIILTRFRERHLDWRRWCRPPACYRHCSAIGSLTVEPFHGMTSTSRWTEHSISKSRNFMTKLEIKGDLNIIKGKLKQKGAKLTDDKLQCVEGKSEELLGRIQKHTSEVREAIKKAVK
jgi:uncharacterized protein YjbJ (UPF0337 family)